jgi:hypothetical protein
MSLALGREAGQISGKWDARGHSHRRQEVSDQRGDGAKSKRKIFIQIIDLTSHSSAQAQQWCFQK